MMAGMFGFRTGAHMLVPARSSTSQARVAKATAAPMPAGPMTAVTAVPITGGPGTQARAMAISKATTVVSKAATGNGNIEGNY